MSEVLTLETIKEINKISSEYEKTLDKLIKPQSKIILLLGSTGSGKTTITTLLMNKQLNIKKYRSKYGKEIVLDLPGSGIGHTNKSETQYPKIHAFGSDLVICDCPGFEDTEGEEQEILHSLELWKLLQKSHYQNKLKILIVASDENMKNEKGNYLQSKIYKRVENIFKGTSLKGSIGLVVTKCYHKELSNNNYKNEPFIRRTFGEDNIFLFPLPNPKEKQYSIKYTDLEKLKLFINDEKNYLNHPSIHFDFNPSTKLILEQSTQLQIKTNTKLLDIISKLIIEDLHRKLYQYEENNNLVEEVIRTLQNQITQIVNIRNSTLEIRDTKKFVFEFLKEFNTQTIQEHLISLEETSTFSQFIEDIFHIHQISDAFQEKKNNMLDNLIDQFNQNIMWLNNQKDFLNEVLQMKQTFSKQNEEFQRQLGILNLKNKKLENEIFEKDETISTIKQSTSLDLPDSVSFWETLANVGLSFLEGVFMGL